MSDIDKTMSLRGEIVDVDCGGLITFKVQTKLGLAYVWVWDEINVVFEVGMDFLIEEAPITFSDGYPVAIIKPGVDFWLDHLVYEVGDPERTIT